MKRLIFIFSFSLFLSAYLSNDGRAQLITDSENRLKTQKQKGKGDGFSLFKKKKGSSSHGPQKHEPLGGAPRYSSGSPFASFNKRKSVTPRSSSSSRGRLFKSYEHKAPRYSSSGIAGIMSGKKSSTRYSPGSPFTKKDKFVTPRYSAGDPFKQSFLSRIFDPRYGPRYSSGSPYSKKDKMVSPRYSAGDPFQKQFSLSGLFGKDSGPRYSAGSPFTKKDKMVSPRYSTGRDFWAKKKAVSPRYSAGDPFQKQFSLSGLFSKDSGPRYSAGSPYTKKDKMVSPRYSAGNVFTTREKSVSPRYSAGSPYDNMRWGWISPAYSTGKHRFDVNEKLKKSRVYDYAATEYKGTDSKKTKWYYDLDNLIASGVTGAFESRKKAERYDPQQNKEAAGYTGSYKKKWITENNMHPSANYTKANQDSEMIRNSMRKWNLFWTRVNRNKQQPNAVTDTTLKPKFDRKEAQIWND
ncbi:hypothetical protein [Marinoscillum sp.]|uniref:hypothetical protein n=1 Tax=Marinoscillum sp. TaxID=2024838 RepID=UPI003BAB24AD